jgi:imidazoleglycerol-phosphate dehydratase
MPPRQASVKRTTKETDITLDLTLDGRGRSECRTGVGFLDHMLDLLAKHALLDLAVQAKGDLQTDQHHTVEDVGIALGQALKEALGDHAGIRRFGAAAVPMEEALAQVAVDLSGRPALVFAVQFGVAKTGEFDTALVEEFMNALVANGRFNLHVAVPHGRNAHHVSEAIFKALAVALRQAVETDPRRQDVPSTKGRLG